MSEIPNLVTPEFEGSKTRNSLATKKCRFLSKYSRFLLRRYVGRVKNEPTEFAKLFNRFEILDADSGETLVIVGQEETPDREGLSFEVYNVKRQRSKLAFSTFYQLNHECCGIIRIPEGMTFGSNGVNIGEIFKGGPSNSPCHAGLSLKTDFPEEAEYNMKGPFCCIGGLCESVCGNRYGIYDSRSKKIGGIRKVSQRNVGKLAPSMGFLLELDTVEDGDSIAHLLSGLLLLETLFYSDSGRKGRISFCSIVAGGKMFDCCCDYSCFINDKQPNTLLDTTKISATQHDHTI